MEERTVARGVVTQRRFEVEPAEEPAKGVVDPPTTPEAPPVVPIPPPRAPSGESLRARQASWLAERARFEEYRRRTGRAGAEAPEPSGNGSG